MIMCLIGNGLTGKMICQTCGQLLDVAGLTSIDYPTCPKCGEKGGVAGHLETGRRLFTLCEEPEECAYSSSGRPHAHYCGNLDIKRGRHTRPGEGHLYLDEALQKGERILYVIVSNRDLSLDCNNNPERSPYLVSYNSQIKGYQIWFVCPSNQETLHEAIKTLHTLLQRGETGKEKYFFESLKGKKAVDNGTSSFSQHSDQDSRRRMLIKAGWVCWDSHRATHRGASTIEYFFEPSQQGVRDLIELLAPYHKCRLDEKNNILYVPQEAIGKWIGKGGEQIKKLSSAWGKRLQVKPIQ